MSTEVTRLRRARASSKPRRAILDLVGPVLHRVEDGAVLANPRGRRSRGRPPAPGRRAGRLRRRARTEVREDVELAAQPQEPLLGTDLGAVKARVADGAQQDGAGARGRGERHGRQRLTGLVDGRAAEDVLLQLEVERQLPQNAGGAAAATSEPIPSPGRSDPHSRAPVTAPSDAEETSAAYLANTPCA